MSPERGVPRAAIAISAVLVLVATAFVWSSLQRPEPPSHEPLARAVLVAAAPDTILRMTVDASHESEWRFFSLAQGAVVAGSAEWDLAFRRFNIATNGGPGFRGVGAAAPADPNDHPPAMQQTSVDTTVSGFGKWYSYGFTSHLLTPKPIEYAVRAADGGAWRMRIISYYCPGVRAGCVTFEYWRKGAGKSAGTD